MLKLFKIEKCANSKKCMFHSFIQKKLSCPQGLYVTYLYDHGYNDKE